MKTESADMTIENRIKEIARQANKGNDNEWWEHAEEIATNSARTALCDFQLVNMAKKDPYMMFEIGEDPFKMGRYLVVVESTGKEIEVKSRYVCCANYYYGKWVLDRSYSGKIHNDIQKVVGWTFIGDLCNSVVI